MPELESYGAQMPASNGVWFQEEKLVQESQIPKSTQSETKPTPTSKEETTTQTKTAIHKGIVQIQGSDPQVVFTEIRKFTSSPLPDTSDVETLEVNLESVNKSPTTHELADLFARYNQSTDPKEKNQLEEKLFLKGDAFVKIVGLSCQGASNGASKTIADMSNAASMAIATVGDLPENKSYVLETLNSLVNLVTQVQTRKEVGDKLAEMKGQLAELRKNLPATEKDAAKIENLEKGIIALSQEQRNLEESFFSLCGLGSSSAVSATSGILKAITVLDPHEAAALLNRLNFVHSAGGMFTGTLGLALNAKAIVDLKNKESQINSKIVELRAQKESAGQNLALVRLIDLKIKNLEMVQQSNNVVFVQTLTSIGANVLGTTAGAVTMFAIAGATTGAVAVIGATAGIGALVLVGGALAVGAGYYAYKHREEIAVYGQLSAAYAEKTVLDTKDLYSRKWEKVDDKRAKEFSMTKQRKEALSSEWNKRIETVTMKVNEEGSSRIDKLRKFEELDAKEIQLAEKEKFLPKDDKDLVALRDEVSILRLELGPDKFMRAEEVAKLASEIVMWRDLKNSIMQKAAKGHSNDVGFEMKAIEEIDAKIEGLKTSLQENENKRKKLQDRLADCKVSSALKNTTVDEVSNFRSVMRENLKDPDTSENIRAFLLGQGVNLKVPPTEADIMSFISKDDI